MPPATATETKPAKTTNWPAPHIGMVVLWKDGREAAGATAFVTAISSTSRLGLSVAHPDAHNFDLKDGVPFVDEEDVREEDAVDTGFWDYTEAVRKRKVK